MSCENVVTIMVSGACAIYYVLGIVLSALLEVTHLILTIMLLINTFISSVLEMGN